MKKHILIFSLIVLIKGTLFGQLALEMTPAYLEVLDSIPDLVLTTASENTSLPYKIENWNHNWMPPIVDQDVDNSCAQAAAIGYVFTYEINRLRDIQSVENANRYPVDFTYNFLNGGSNQGSSDVNGWKIVQEIGCPNIDTYEPGGDGFTPDKFWMSGYEKYFSGITNRIDTSMMIKMWYNFDDLKHWLNDHGQGDESGGLAVFFVNSTTFPMSTATMTEGEGAGTEIITSWYGWERIRRHYPFQAGY